MSNQLDKPGLFGGNIADAIPIKHVLTKTSDVASTARLGLVVDQNVEQPPLHFVVLAGGIGGAFADLSLHSMDTVKTRLQAQPFPLRYSGTWNALRTIVMQEGFFRGLYSGVSAAMIGSIPSTMLYFASYEQSKRLLLPYVPDSVAHLVSGAFGDFIGSTIMVPAEVIKTRLQMQGRHNNHLRSTSYNYRNVWDAFVTIWRTEGVGALYYGYRATLIRDMPFSAFQFAIYEYLKQSILQRAERAKSGVKAATMTFSESLLAGAISGGLAGAMTTPLDVVKTQLQTSSQSSLQMSRGIVRSLLKVYHAEGLKGLFRGVTPRVLWTMPQSSILFVGYESLLSWMLSSYSNDFKFSPSSSSSPSLKPAV